MQHEVRRFRGPRSPVLLAGSVFTFAVVLALALVFIPRTLTLAQHADSDSAGAVATGSINGTVTDEETGEPLEDIPVTFSATYHSFGGGTRTDASGSYRISGLPADDYRLGFNFPNTGMYLSEWYNDQSDRESADLVLVIEDEKTEGIDAALALGGSISGTLTDENTGEPLEGVCVSASDVSQSWSGHGYTDASGSYTVGGLRTGDYSVRFYDCTDGRAYEWYNDQPDYESADLVTVTEKAKTEGIDAALAGKPTTIGDVDCGGLVNAIDAALILQFAAGLLGSLPCPENADVNSDGNVTAVDAALILQFAAGLLTSLPP